MISIWSPYHKSRPEEGCFHDHRFSRPLQQWGLQKTFRYLTRNADGYALSEGDREQLFQELLDANIPYSIEPGVSLQSCEEVLMHASENSGRIFPAIGIHPTRSIYEKWSDRKKLDAYAKMLGVIAIGECGLDYHYKREEQHRLKQHIWFLYQLDLAWKLKKPVILHVRDAHEDALRILRFHPARKLGGVIHCFYGSCEIAEQYLKLGYDCRNIKFKYLLERCLVMRSIKFHLLTACIFRWNTSSLKCVLNMPRTVFCKK